MAITLRTDLDIVQLPSPLPDFGGLFGANTICTDPDFGTKIVRATDASCDRSRSIFTGDIASNCAWNTNDTLVALRHAGGVANLYQFSPETMQVKQLPQVFTAHLCFSSIDPNTLYFLNGVSIWKYILPTTGLAEISLLADFSNILPAGFAADWRGALSHSVDDKTFVLAISAGIQDTAYLCCVWREGSGYRMLNTQTGEITGEWGEIGTSKSRPYGPKNLIHDAATTPNPRYASVGILDSGPGASSIWDIGTLNVLHGIVDGHRVLGYKHYYAGGLGGGQFAEVPYANPTTKRLIVPADALPREQDPPQAYVGDMHSGFGKLKEDDDSIFWTTSSTTETPFTSCWMNEVRGYQASGPESGTVYRACHTFSSGQSKEFVVENSIGLPSQTGRFVAFSSDMMGTLGSTTGAAQGTLGVDARGDVFIVQVAE